MIKRHSVKSCCGSKSFIFQLPKSINKGHVDDFKQNDYTAPEHFINAGLFYVQKEGLIARGSFGSRKLQVHCNQKNQDRLLNELEDILKQVLDE